MLALLLKTAEVDSQSSKVLGARDMHRESTQGASDFEQNVAEWTDLFRDRSWCSRQLESFHSRARCEA